jgi:hypothetical protein
MALEQGQAPEAQEQQPAPAGMEGSGVEAPSRGGTPPPGAEDMTPEQQEMLKRVMVLAQTALADKKANRQIVEQAATGDDGLISATVAILSLVIDKMDIDSDMVIPAAASIMLVILDFLVKIGKAKADPNRIGQLVGKLGAVVGQQFKLDPEMVKQQMGGAAAPGQAGPQGGPQPQQPQSKLGALGQMMGGA